MAGPSSRMLALLSLLQVHRDWPGDELAGRLEVSPRTVRRDVDRLRELGYRVEALRGPAGGYRLAAGSDLPPLLFDDDQAVAIALALAAAPASGADIAESAARALATVRQVMPARLRSRIDAVQAVSTSGRTRTDPDVLVAVSEAVHLREVFRFGYGEDETLHRVEPHAVVARNGRWYLLDWDLDHDDWRTHRVDRITPRMRTRVPFTPRPVPGDDPAAFVSARFKGSAQADVWPCVGSVTMTAADARTITPYLPEDAVVEPLSDERSRVTLGSWSWPGLAGAFAGFAVDFVVEGPEDLRDAVGALATRLRAASAR
ncbi:MULTISPECIES: YafY family protein [unclassified Curtobacterium]|uniref:helix-turn-helix transcriptional regulator n=1 Tax=unclassified Curtobacterium TaxID=257496 RepID=UPI000F4AF3A9|nr:MULTISPECIES: WYL domain-containing protein [unclassified Curtobacterium]ROQ16396.1 putative DNA-binding transcriptional regulator YafY [Curtobacterium sp. PhB171]ROQ25528.1 putative DNA-binding transcriptional regulator YafY [Curtobacterium sp. PhB170]ROS36980.1 putative DNA-binding transcriptional regulator YafY [Curtobacterium sp. PhB131]ROS71656.1 putative DNA-binding transcriptional regulator YafY [Curtobacterium sp. PhB141]